MNRRDFLKAAAKGIIVSGVAPSWAFAEPGKIAQTSLSQKNYEPYIKDYLYKIKNFNKDHQGDIYLQGEKKKLLKSVVNRLKRLYQIVGHADFSLLSFDEALKIAENYSAIGCFSNNEIEFMEMTFYGDADQFGFLGKKPLMQLTAYVPEKEIIKIPYSGNHLFKGLPLETYTKIKRVVGDQLILSSGVRSIMKQMLLFLNKAYMNHSNLSLASRSLAPPGYSYHGIGDFDVGQVGFGEGNFTENFITTDVYKKLEGLGYLTLRYPRENMLGVRFEPWHVKVIADL